MSTKKKQYWLVKFAPFRTPWNEIVRRGMFRLRGIRNPQARNNLKEMRSGDQVLYYHSQKERQVVGVMKVVKEAYPDPTTADTKWLTCDFSPIRTLPKPVSLAEIKSDERLENTGLVRQPRLSVMPLTAEEFNIIANIQIENEG